MSTNPSAFGNSPTGTAGGALTGTYPNPTLGNTQSPPWIPADNGLLLANLGDPGLLTSTAIVTAGTLYLMKLSYRSSMTVTSLWFEVSVVGAGASTTSFVGLYNSAGTLLSGSSDIGALFAAAQGPVQTSLTTPQAIVGGTFGWVALLFNLATTQPTLLKGATATGNVPNLGLAASAYRFATNGTALSALPGSITPASNSAAALISIWTGVS